MSIFYALLLAFLELNFVFIVLGLLHCQRRRIGSIPFYLSMGVVFLLGQLVGGAGLVMDIDTGIYGNYLMPIGPTLLFTPFLAMVLLIYITEGALAMQRLMMGMLVILGIFLYLGGLTSMQCDWRGFFSSSGLSGEALKQLLAGTRHSMMAMLAVQLVDMFVLPICFTWIRHVGGRLFLSLLGALVITQTVDAVLYQLLMRESIMSDAGWLNAAIIVRLLSSVWVCVLLTMYVLKIEGANDLSSLPKSSFEIIYAFFGGYGRSKSLEKNLLESEWRYRKVIDSTSEMVLLTDASGEITEANPAASEFFGVPPEKLAGENFFAVASGFEAGDTEHLRELESVNRPGRIRIIRAGDAGKIPDAAEGNVSVASVTMNPFVFRDRPMRIVVGRDITGELRSEEEKRKLFEQLAHAQRLDAIGQLAGGIAHDFNNHIHAILGNVDVMNLKADRLPEDARKRLDKIAMIAEQAGALTGQLLGFARMGKYRETVLDLRELIKKSSEMFAGSRKNSAETELELKIPDTEMLVSGDFVQLSQVIINLLLNARDAARDGSGVRIVVSAGEASFAPLPFKRPEAFALVGGTPEPMPEDYWYVAVCDNGCGMTPEIMKKIFEPFFTTKPVGKGVGMGLAMSYGTISNHHGWMQVASRVGEGTTFCIILPKAAGALG